MEGSSDIGCRHARATGRELSDPAPDNYHDASRATATSPSATSWLTRPAGARLLTSLGTCRTPLLPCGRRWREALPPQPVERRAFFGTTIGERGDSHRRMDQTEFGISFPRMKSPSAFASGSVACATRKVNLVSE